jgi:capsular polysaccharide biosynthesis protein
MTQNFEIVEVDEAIVVKDTTPGNNFGHFLIDQLPKIALYEAAGIDVKTAAIIGEKLTTGFQREMVDALGIKHYIEMERRVIVRAKRLHICSDCIQPQLIAHYGESWGLNFMRRAFDIAPLDGVKTQSTGTRRLYISRNDGNTRRISNEDEILPVLRSFGFEMIRPGSMSFREQVEAFRDASHIFGPHGANLANMIFAPAGLNLLECFHPLFTPFNYMRIVPALSMSYAAMIATDAESDDPRFNDPDTAVPWRPDVPFVWHYRDIRVDPIALTSWLNIACSSRLSPAAG